MPAATPISAHVLYLYRQSWRTPVVRDWLGHQMAVSALDIQAVLFAEVPQAPPVRVALVDWCPELGSVVRKLDDWLPDETPVVALIDEGVPQAASAYALGVDVVETFPPAQKTIEDLIEGTTTASPPAPDTLTKAGSFSERRRLLDGSNGTLASVAERPSQTIDTARDVRSRIVIDVARHKCWIDGQPMHLPVVPFRMLHHLIERDGACCSRQELLDVVWGEDYVSGSDVVSTTVKRLRSVLRPAGLHERLQTVRGVGYRFSLDQ